MPPAPMAETISYGPSRVPGFRDSSHTFACLIRVSTWADCADLAEREIPKAIFFKNPAVTGIPPLRRKSGCPKKRVAKLVQDGEPKKRTHRRRPLTLPAAKAADNVGCEPPQPTFSF